MPLERNIVLELVQTILKELGEDLEIEGLSATDEQTRLFGSRSALDSMGLVNLITDIEEKLSDEHDIHITLASQSAMSRTHSPFRKVGSCVNYIMELIEAANAQNPS
jgi:acyl carrier protein